MLLPLYEAVLSALPHDAPLLAIEKLVYRMQDTSALDAVCQQSEEGWRYGLHQGRATVVP
jgi:hypothetical protein